jgi:hypothetical protein
VCRTSRNEREADVVWEEPGKSTEETPRGKGPSIHPRNAEIKSGRANNEQELTATSKDLSK